MTEEQSAASIGAALAQAREALGLTVGDVAQQLKFAPRQIEALERDNFGELPGGTFARGMVRSYARLLRLDPEPLVARMAASVATSDNAEALAAIRRPIPITDSSRRSNLVYAVLSLSILAVIGVVIVEWQAERSRAARLSFVPAAQAPAAPAEAPRTEVASTVTPQIATLDTAPAAAAVAVAPASAPAPAPAETPAAVAPAPAPKPAASAEGARRIALRFEQESWVEIRGRGDKLLLAQLNLAGTERTVEGKPPFSVVIGNAHHVRISYDDRPVDLTPHIKVEVARFTLE